MLKNVIIVLLFSTFAMADAPISGQVFSTNGNPLAYAVIADFTDQNQIIADENGQFNYHFSAGIGDTLSISRYGYQTSNFVVSDRFFYALSLIPKPIKQDDVTVSGENQNFIGQMTNTYQRNIGNDNPQNVFRQIPGITIRSY